MTFLVRSHLTRVYFPTHVSENSLPLKTSLKDMQIAWKKIGRKVHNICRNAYKSPNFYVCVYKSRKHIYI